MIDIKLMQQLGKFFDQRVLVFDSYQKDEFSDLLESVLNAAEDSNSAQNDVKILNEFIDFVFYTDSYDSDTKYFGNMIIYSPTGVEEVINLIRKLGYSEGFEGSCGGYRGGALTLYIEQDEIKTKLRSHLQQNCINTVSTAPFWHKNNSIEDIIFIKNFQRILEISSSSLSTELQKN